MYFANAMSLPHLDLLPMPGLTGTGGPVPAPQQAALNILPLPAEPASDEGKTMETFVFDVETGPLPEAELAAMVPAFDPAEVRTGNLKDPEKVAAKIAEAEASHRREFIERAALDPLTGRVLAIGLLRMVSADPHPTGNGHPLPANGRGMASLADAVAASRAWEFRVIGYEDEARTLREFWEVCRGEMGRLNELIGFNCRAFDLPFLIRRSFKHRVRVPFGVRRGRYWADEMVDLRELWQLGDRQARGSLESIARHLGVGEKRGSGADFARLWQSDRGEALRYLRNDLELTARVAEALGCFAA